MTTLIEHLDQLVSQHSKIDYRPQSRRRQKRFDAARHGIESITRSTRSRST